MRSDRYYHPYPYGLEILLVLLLGILGGVVFSNNNISNINQSASNNQNNSADTVSTDTGIADPDFNKAMRHILKWEGDGKCSNDPHDRGGRTYMGITIGRGREYGYSDPCKMPRKKVFEIYYKSYWVRVPKNLGGPEKLAYFNMIVNGSSRACLRKPNAISMLNCQQEFYRNAPTAWKHLKGWTNRNNYMKTVVSNWQD